MGKTHEVDLMNRRKEDHSLLNYFTRSLFSIDHLTVSDPKLFLIERNQHRNIVLKKKKKCKNETRDFTYFELLLCSK